MRVAPSLPLGPRAFAQLLRSNDSLKRLFGEGFSFVSLPLVLGVLLLLLQTHTFEDVS